MLAIIEPQIAGLLRKQYSVARQLVNANKQTVVKQMCKNEALKLKTKKKFEKSFEFGILIKPNYLIFYLTLQILLSYFEISIIDY
jgi:hypothetical protein